MGVSASAKVSDLKIENLVAGTPDYKTVTFEYQGVLSKPVPVVGATQQEIIDAVSFLYEPHCPLEFTLEGVKKDKFLF